MIEKVFAFILGSCVGSFLNVCIWRLPQNISIIKPRSYCPHCNAMIGWYHNIPLLSYWWLKRRCANCGQPIALGYFLVELVTAGLFLVLYIKFGFTAYFFKFAFFFCMLILMSCIDVRYHAVPEILPLLGIGIGVCWSFGETYFWFRQGGPTVLPGDLPFILAFRGLIFGLGFTYLFKLCADLGLRCYLHWRKLDSIEGETESLGLGDVDLMGMIGVFIGIKLSFIAFFAAPVFALLYVLFALFFKRSHLVPYIPYLSVAAFFAFLWGNRILMYFNL
ncbi:MAG: prepilin peptidase [Candidatus Omnitrophica bacterium]|nr:prepilin peptidase [Candidatus Omnitrophota bacterium]